MNLYEISKLPAQHSSWKGLQLLQRYLKEAKEIRDGKLDWTHVVWFPHFFLVLSGKYLLFYNDFSHSGLVFYSEHWGTKFSFHFNHLGLIFSFTIVFVCWSMPLDHSPIKTRSTKASDKKKPGKMPGQLILSDSAICYSDRLQSSIHAAVESALAQCYC